MTYHFGRSPEEIAKRKAQNRANYERNKDKIKARTSAYAKTDAGRKQREEYRNRQENKAKRKAWLNEYFAKDGVRDRENARAAMNSRMYRSGINLDTFRQMHEMQGGLCAICGVSLSTRLTHIDHCHETEAIRGLLCMSCNTTEGRIRATGIPPIEFARKLHDYLNEPPAKELGLKWKPIKSKNDITS